MGLYTIDCPECGEVLQWFSGNIDQRCSKCMGESGQNSPKDGPTEPFRINKVEITNNSLNVDLEVKVVNTNDVYVNLHKIRPQLAADIAEDTEENEDED